ncbi:SNF7 family protein [Forsythia ovata]|uniref:SNF7 family protein n=1 Tax=Forsythia ovata TaxID=205694 RepID=A0ABD1R1X3_9LAMI
MDVEKRDIEEAEEMMMKMVADFLRKEVRDWDNEDKMKARFKALSGQRCDWEPLYLFWRDLIIKVARHLHIFILRPLHIKHLWFRQGGLSPLCLDRVLVEMYNAGDLLPVTHLLDPTTEGWRLPQILRKAAHVMGLSRASTPLDGLTEDCYVLAPLLKEKSLEVVKCFSENHWTPSCIITMKKFQEICGGSKEASAILSYLSECRKAKYFVVNKIDRIEGVKVCLDPGVVSSITSIDYNVLHLIWTVEKLEQQLDLIDQRYEKSKKSALASLKGRNKSAALRYAKELKLTSQSRDKCTNLLDRVEEVLGVIADAESSNKVSEAIQISTQALKDNQTSIEEVTLCLQDLDENIDSLKQVDKVLGSNLALAEIGDEDLEDEFTKLELEIESQPSQNLVKVGIDDSTGVAEVSAATNSLSNALSNLNLKEGAALESVTGYSVKTTSKNPVSKEANLEPA